MEMLTDGPLFDARRSQLISDVSEELLCAQVVSGQPCHMQINLLQMLSDFNKKHLFVLLIKPDSCFWFPV